MIFGLTIEKLLLIGLVAALIVGPERLPRYAESLAAFARRARDWMSTAKTRVRDEMGEDTRAIATGGLAAHVVPYCETIDDLDDLLTLTGLRLLHERNSV